ncbi:PEP-CTERM sorting domain-containing protein [Roseateles sp.]|uniref:PEP-CTERM sorting domain-containing protein n=1 Tax=Roseateles sp. TaxID=1971397 RepID=UPI003265C70A
MKCHSPSEPRPPAGRCDRAARLAAGCLVALGGAGSAAPALAQSSFLAYTTVCQSECFSGPTVFWTPPAGATGDSSVSHGWSYVSTTSDTSSNYAVSAAAQASISGVDRWSASSNASGYFNSSGAFNGNGVVAYGVIRVRDEFTLQSTPSWNGPGWLRLSYRISGDVALTYAESSDVSGQTLGSAQSSITFECGSARVGGIGSSRCESPDFPAPAPGSMNLIGHLDFNTGQHVDRIVSFSMPVYSDALYAYGLQTTVSSKLMMNATNRLGRIEGNTAADFSHTFSLVDAELFDAGLNPVSQWSIRAASGLDYANLAAVPEPGTATLLALGIGLVGWRLRRQRGTRQIGAAVCRPSHSMAYAQAT